MALRIVKAEEPIKVDRINLCLYGVPGIGKSTTAFTAESPLLLDFDRGAYRAANRRDVVQVADWSDVTSITQDDLKPYATVVIDTAGRALDYLSGDIMRSDPKMRRGSTLTLQGYGALKGQFSAWLKQLNTFGKDVILIAHMDEQKNGDDIIERLDVQGGSKGEIYKSVDAMGRLFIKGNKRTLDFSPREGSFGKNPAQFPELEIPDVKTNARFLAEIIGKIKAHLNQFSADQQAEQRIVEDWEAVMGTLFTVDDYNQHMTEIKSAPLAVKSRFNKSAKEMGYHFDKEKNLFVASEVAA